MQLGSPPDRKISLEDFRLTNRRNAAECRTEELRARVVVL